jgi:ABC-type branched-subunit amino acid transport system ATPase component/ABC-type branched-subunit amino acid transport system permease subunit
LSALVAMGLVLVYRANRIVNFAQGDIGGVAAVLCASLLVGPKWGFFPAFVVGLATALALGAVTERFVIRRFAKAPRLILTVATIGLQQVFAAGELGLPRLFNYNTAPQPPTPFHFRFHWFPVTFNAGHLLILIVVPLVGLGLAAFFRYTDVGIAVRASAESADRAALLGVPVKRLETLVWVIAAGMSGLGVLLRLPIQGVSIGEVLGPSLLLRALAAAVIGRMESLWVTAIAAMGLGMMEQAVLFKTGRTVIADAVLFFVILAALLLQRTKLSRGEDVGASSWSATGEVRPVPRELARLPVVRALTVGPFIVLAAFLVLGPLAMSGGSVNLLAVALIYAMVISSLLILTGWAGQISLGHLAFVAFGASVAGAMALDGKDFFWSLAASGLAGAGVAIVIGVPALRIRGLFLAVTTLAFALATGTYFLNGEFFSWVPPAGTRVSRPVIFDKFDLDSDHAMFYVVLIAFALVTASVRSLRRSRTGRVLIGVRDNPRSAQSYGVSPIRTRLVAFVLSGFIAGLAGGLYNYQQRGISNNVLLTPNNLKIFSIAVIGGLGSIPGALLGAGYLTILDYSPLTKTTIARLFSSGLGLLIIVLVLPSGLGGLLYAGRDWLLRVVARRKAIIVPSLVADVAVDRAETDEAPTEQIEAAPAGERLLSVDGVDVSYGKTQVLFGVNFTVDRGEIVALLGTNGAGKSTLLSAICGLVPPGAGTITFDGRDITRHAPEQTLATGIALMPGGRAVFPTLTVEENLRLAAWLYRKDADYVRTATEQVLEYFPILRERWHERAGDLSGGEQQMCALGQAFIAKPDLLMIDELSLGLAPVVVQRLLDIVRQINDNATAVVLVEQSVNIAITLAQRAVFLEKGEVRFEGATADLLDRPDILRAVFLKGAAAAQGDGRRRAQATAKTIFLPVCERCGREHPVRLEARELSVSFGGIHAVDGVDLAVREGQILGIIGPNGAGKTTVFDLVSGYVEPTRGVIVLDGDDVTQLPADARAERGLGRSFQDARLFPSLTVRETIALALERHVAVRDPLAAALLSPAVKVSERKVAEEVDRLIEELNLQAFADKFVGELSTGTRRVVDLACSTAHNPKVLLLDEPSSGLAQRETEALAGVLLGVRDRLGAALIVVEHDMPLITSISDELVALDLGRVVAQGDPQHVIDHPAVVEGYLGSSTEVIQRSGRRKSPGKRVTA